MATLGTLSGQTLTYGVDKYIVLSGSFAVTYEPMGTKYLVTITLEDSKHICVLSVQDFISLLQLQQKENEKLKEEENKKLKKKLRIANQTLLLLNQIVLANPQLH